MMSPAPPINPRALGSVNWIGLRTMTAKEIGRFIKSYPQTIIAPVISTVLFFTVFAFVLGDNQTGVPRGGSMSFLVLGLVMMTIAQNAFMNTAGSLVLSKVQGNIVDVLMPPLSPFEITIAYMVGGIARGIVVGISCLAALYYFVPVEVYNPFYIIYYAISGSMMFALIGIICGIWSEKFDHMFAVHSFVVLPATFLSGAFFTIDSIPEKWRLMCHLNPFFYVTDGFRYGFTGVADSVLFLGLAFVFVINLALLGAAYCLFESGYKLKA